MDGGNLVVGAEPDAKRQRVGEEYHRVRRDTFVESMLTTMAETLASDAEYGYNPANRIRQRVEQITEQIDDQADDALRSSSRAVLEARFALGFDDSQYLSQAVSLLWAGDGGERLRIAPLNSMPEIMRVSSANGMIQAMGSVVKSQKKEATTAIKRALRLAAWLMQMECVRVAVLDVLSAGFDADSIERATHKIVSDAFAGGTALTDGSATVLGLLQTPKGMEKARALIVAFLVVVNPTALPSAVVGKLLSAMRQVVVRTENDMAKTFNVAIDMDGALDRVLKSSDERAGVLSSTNPRENPATDLQLCPERIGYDGRPPATKPPFKEFATALNEAVNRISCNHSSLPSTDSNVTTMEQLSNRANFDADARDADKGWMVDRIVSPVWQTVQPRQWQELLGTGNYIQPIPGVVQGPTGVVQPPAGAAAPSRRTNSQVSGTMLNTVRLDNIGRRKFDDETLQELSSGMLDGKASMEEAFVQFAMVRGLCGHRGIHQSSGGAVNEVLTYDFPTDNLQGYKKGEFVEQRDATLSPAVTDKILQVEKDIYTAERMRLDTDFVGNVLASSVVGRLNMDSDNEEVAIEPARRARWMPTSSTPDSPFEYSEYAQMVCEASVYEFMTKSLTDPSAEDDDECLRLMRAAAAVAKLHQMECAAYVKSVRVDEDMMYSPEKMGADSYVTRPCAKCNKQDEAFGLEDLAVPVDAGIARIRPIGSNPDPLRIEAPDDATPQVYEQRYRSPFHMAYTMGFAVGHGYLNQALSFGMQSGWQQPGGGDDDIMNGNESDRVFSMFMGPAADAEPLAEDDLGSAYSVDTTNFNKLLPEDMNIVSIFNAFGNAIAALDAIIQIECEQEYVDKFKQPGSDEQQRVFGLHRSVEDASRDRRSDLWTDALREVAISGDRLYRFVTELTGAIGESADSAISWEDEDLKAMAKEAATKQKAMADRVSRFQTKLVESVITSTLRASKLQLDVRDRGAAANELVVINTDVKEGIRQITSGEAGHGFFEASVELNSLIGGASKPITIKDLVNRLQYVSMEFQDQLQSSMASSTPMSYSRIAEPRNSFMMHLKPDTVAAVHKAFDLITSEMRACPGHHRHVYLWEYIEGKDWVLSSRFAELVGLMLQNTRMRSGSFAAYVGTSQIITNTQNVRMQIQRLRSQVCSYIMANDTPQFLSKVGRTMYFGGTTKDMSSDADAAKRLKRRKDGPNFGGDGGFYGDFWDSKPDKKQYAAKDSIIRRLKELTAQVSNGKLPYDAFAISNNHGLDVVQSPMMKRRYFRGATQLQVQTSFQKALFDELGHDPVQLKMIMQAALMHAQAARAMDPRPVAATPAAQPTGAGSCFSKFKYDEYGWLSAICEQFDKKGMPRAAASGDLFFEPVTPTPLPDHDGSGTKYYVVNFKITTEMLKDTRFNETLSFGRRESGALASRDANAFVKWVSHLLDTLFLGGNKFVGKARHWQPHKLWRGLSDKAQTDISNTWVLEFHQEDSRWRKAVKTVAKTAGWGAVTMGLALPRAVKGATMYAVKKPKKTLVYGLIAQGAAAALAGYVGPGPTQQIAGEVISNLGESSGVFQALDFAGAKVGDTLPVLADAGRFIGSANKGYVDFWYAQGAHVGYYKGWAYDKFMIAAVGRENLAKTFASTISKEIAKTDAILKSIGERQITEADTAAGVKLDPAIGSSMPMTEDAARRIAQIQEREIPKYRELEQVLKSAQASVAKLLVNARNPKLFDEILEGSSALHVWRDQDGTMASLEEVTSSTINTGSGVEVATKLKQLVAESRSAAASVNDVVGIVASMPQERQHEFVQTRMDLFLSRRSEALKTAEQRLSQYMESENYAAYQSQDSQGGDPYKASLLAPFDRNELAKYRSLSTIPQIVQRLQAEITNLEDQVATEAGLSTDVDAKYARDLSVLQFWKSALAEIKTDESGNAILSESDKGTYTLNEKLAFLALFQWNPAVIENVERLLSPTTASITLAAKVAGQSVDGWMEKNQEELVGILRSNPLIGDDDEVVQTALEQLRTPIAIRQTPSTQYQAPAANYLRFFTYMFGAALKRFATDQVEDMRKLEEAIEEKYPDGGFDPDNILQSFVLDKKTGYEIDDLKWVQFMREWGAATTDAAKETAIRSYRKMAGAAAVTKNLGELFYNPTETLQDAVDDLLADRRGGTRADSPVPPLEEDMPAKAPVPPGPSTTLPPSPAPPPGTPGYDDDGDFAIEDADE